MFTASSAERAVPLSQRRAVNGRDLAAGLAELLQVIDGEFVATESDRESPWVIVRAVDSSWWEAVCDDAEVRHAICKRFRQVEEHEFDTA